MSTTKLTADLVNGDLVEYISADNEVVLAPVAKVHLPVASPMAVIIWQDGHSLERRRMSPVSVFEDEGSTINEAFGALRDASGVLIESLANAAAHPENAMWSEDLNGIAEGVDNSLRTIRLRLAAAGVQVRLPAVG